MNLYHFVKESNRIEGITRVPTRAEISAHKKFLSLETITITDLCDFVAWVADAPIRDKPGMNVQVGAHKPPLGGSFIVDELQVVLDHINSGCPDPWGMHIRYETLHPFMDGNGRSGRVLWLWMMGGIENAPRGFLHEFYYQTLQASR